MLAKSFLSLLLFGLAVSALPFPQGSSDGDENPATANDGDGSGSNGGNGTLNGINNGNTLASNLLDNDNTGNLGITNSGNVQIGSSCDKKVHQNGLVNVEPRDTTQDGLVNVAPACV